MKQLDSTTFVSGQIAPAELPGLAASGVTAIVNNRPDGEEPGQPSSAEMEAAARAAGLAYWHIPVAGGFGADQVLEMAQALQGAEGKVLAYCKSGTRSAYLWALARSHVGTPGEELIGLAAEAGYDLRPIAPYLD
jgi:uncharacterized protein (TIGR01244 family)